MKANRITTIVDPLFPQVWAIYQGSFPLIEQRTLEHQITALRCPSYFLEYYTDGGKIVGIIGYWLFEDYFYIEHYAIDPLFRSGGYGSLILRTIQESTPTTLILEIDQVVDETSSRRLQFYERLGFVQNPYQHPLPRYRDPGEHRDAMLTVLSYPGPINTQLYEKFCRDLDQVVMQRI